jgi:hypothetical protein
MTHPIGPFDFVGRIGHPLVIDKKFVGMGSFSEIERQHPASPDPNHPELSFIPIVETGCQ